MDFLCRCCLNGENSSLYPLSSILIEDAKLTILEVLGTVTSSNLNQSASLPNNICPKCLKSLKKAFNFIVMFQASQITLVNLLTEKPNDSEVELRSDEDEADEKIGNHDDDIQHADATVIKSENYIKNKRQDDLISVTSNKELKNNENQHFISMTKDDVLRKEREEKLLENPKRVHFECYLCGRKYVVKNKLAHHIRVKHQSPTKKRVQCSICAKTVQNTSIRKHMITHDKHNFRCSYCPYTSATKNNLNAHQRTHTGERPFKCQYCTKTFSHVSSKIAHESWWHTGIRKFECPYCPKKFVKNDHLASHKLSHSGEFVCQICCKSFPEAATLERHHKRAHGSTK